MPKADPLAEAAARVRALQDRLEPALLRFAVSTFSRRTVDLARTDFLLDEKPEDRSAFEPQLFYPWFFYRWSPDEDPERQWDPDFPDEPLALMYCKAESAAGRLTEADELFLTTAMDAALSFHEIVEIEPGRSLRLREVFLGSEATVYDRKGSEGVAVGDLLFGRVADFDDVALLIGSGSIILPPDAKIPLIAYRKHIPKLHRRLGGAGLMAGDETFRQAYFDLRRDLLERPMPTLQNTDGDPLELQTLVWKTPGPEATFAALASLSIMASEEEIRRDATLDASGHVRRVEFSWEKPGNKMEKSWSNTVLGRVEIDGTKLTIEVNSARRADLARAEVKKRLGGKAFGPSIEQVPMDLTWPPTGPPGGGGKAAPPGSSMVSLRDHPELAAMMRAQEEAHWDSWIHEKIPALGNKKPSQLVKTAEGREMVEALLRSFERRPRPDELGGSYDINLVRDRLGLPRR